MHLGKAIAIGGMVVAGVFGLAALYLDATNSGFTITGSGSGDGDYAFESMFSEEHRVENFRHIERFSPVKVIPAADNPESLPRLEGHIEFSSSYRGKEVELKDFLVDTMTTGFLVIKGGAIISEQYYHGNGPSAKNASFSMAKSVVSALVGLAIEDGLIGSITDPINKYLPELSTPTFDGVTIKHVLQMSSGIAFNEDYSDPESDINKMSIAVQTQSYIDYIKTLGRWEEPGKSHVYASINTQILGLLVNRVTGKGLSEYLSEKIWQPAGMEFDAVWALDAEGLEQAMGGLAMSLRDYGRFGLIYLNEGRWEDKQLIPASWVNESVTPDQEHLLPGEKERSFTEFGYQYQWWVPRKPRGDFLALGIFGQHIYVDPENNVVIVKLSADDSTFWPNVEYKQVEYLQALSESL